MFRLDNKVAIITGGGSGIGEAISLLFAQQGAVVNILDVLLENADTVKDKIEAEGGTAHTWSCDVSNQGQVQEVFRLINEECGKVDILINNAGIAHIGNVETTTEADMDKVYNINVKGVYNCLQSGVEYMKKSGGGVILNLASIASVVGLSDRFAYSMSKGAVMTMTYSVARDYIEDNIRCNAIAPGRVHTPFVDNFLAKNYPGKEEEMFDKLSKTQPIGRMGTPKEMASLTLYLCSDEAGFVTGSMYGIDGGFITLNT